MLTAADLTTEQLEARLDSSVAAVARLSGLGYVETMNVVLDEQRLIVQELAKRKGVKPYELLRAARLKCNRERQRHINGLRTREGMRFNDSVCCK